MEMDALLLQCPFCPHLKHSSVELAPPPVDDFDLPVPYVDVFPFGQAEGHVNKSDCISGRMAFPTHR